MSAVPFTKQAASQHLAVSGRHGNQRFGCGWRVGAELRSVYGWWARQRAVRGRRRWLGIGRRLRLASGWWWACCAGGAGRDLRHVGVRGGESVGAAQRNVHWWCGRQAREWRVGALLEHGRARRGWRCRWKGCRDEARWAAGARWWSKVHDLRGLVWCTSGLPAGISRCAGLLLVGWRAATLSHACHKWRETWWDGGRYVGTIDAGRREGRDALGRVNMA